MANDDVYYNMGQIRYSTDKKDIYNTNIDIEIVPYNTVDTRSGLIYRDILIKRSPRNIIFNNNSVYCINLNIPRNQTYDMVFDLLLVNTDDLSNDIMNKYQVVKTIKVSRSNIGNVHTSTVVLYPIGVDNEDESKEDVRVGIVRDTLPNTKRPENIDLSKSKINNWDVVKKWIDSEQTQFYYYYYNNNSWTQLNSYKDIILPHVWAQESTSEIANFKIVFSNKVPSETSFNALLLKMHRIGDEADIRFQKDGQDYYGLYVDENNMSETKCYELNNWINNGNIISNISNGVLNSIGVWSHPNSIMTINGEEIRIGQSGYYELNDFDISYFSMLVTGDEDKFSVDYQYKMN